MVQPPGSIADPGVLAFDDAVRYSGCSCRRIPRFA
jgi:hypothetical protein